MKSGEVMSNNCKLQKLFLLCISFFIFQYQAISSIQNEEFKINTTSSSSYINTKLIQLVNNSYVAIWRIGFQGGAGILAQLFNSEDNKIGDEFTVAIPDSDFQLGHWVEAFSFSDGSFIIFWDKIKLGTPDQPGIGNEIHFQKFNSTGEKIGNEIILKEKIEYGLGEFVQLLPNDNFIISWCRVWAPPGSINREDLYIQIFSKDGKKLSSELMINNVSDGKFYGSIKMDLLLDSKVIVVWRGSDGHIYAQLYSLDGNKINDVLIMNDPSQYAVVNPLVEALPDGKFYICWASGKIGSSYYDLIGQLFSNNGEKIGESLQINQKYNVSPHMYYRKNVMELSNLNKSLSIMLWEGHNSDLDIFGQLLTNNGMKQGEEFIINTELSNSQDNLQFEIISDTSFIVVWRSWEQDGYKSGLFAQLFNFEGEKVGKEFRVNQITTGDEINQKLLSFSNNDVIISWQRNGIYATHIQFPITTGIQREEYVLPIDLNVHQNFPNPFNSTTQLIYELPEDSYIEAKNFDVQGREILELLKEFKIKDKYNLTWDGKNQLGQNVASGIYIINFSVKNSKIKNYFQTNKKVILVR